MDHYSILGVQNTATSDQIKKAYRKLAIKHHPDKNGGNKESEEMFKKVSDAYSILGDEEKRKTYDSSRFTNRTKTNAGGFGFEDFVNNFGTGDFRKRSSDYARKSQGRQHAPPPSTDHLNIYLNDKITLSDAMLGKKIELNFSRQKITYTGKNGNLLSYDTEIEERDIAITIDLRKKYIIIKKDGGAYTVSARVPKLGNEEVTTQLNIWGDIEQVPLIGDLHVTLELEIPDDVQIEGNSIIQIIPIPLSKVLFSGEKIKVETIVNKKYEVDFNQPQSVSRLKFTIPNEGLLDESNKLGEYFVKFNVMLPNIESLSKDDFTKLKSLILDCENKS
jgi:curved DNA-binding protein